MIRKIFLPLILLGALLVSGCATPLGQQYGVLGAGGGAIVGGALSNDVRGAAVGAGVGALLGGLIGDQQTFDMERDRMRNDRPYPVGRPYERRVPDYRHDGRRDGYDYGRRDGYDYGHRDGGYVRPCRQVREPVFDHLGYVVGHRNVCR